MKKSLGAALGAGMEETLNRHQRERAYDKRQGQLFLSRARDTAAAVVDPTAIGFWEAHDYESRGLNLSGVGPTMGPLRANHANDQYHVPQMGVPAAKLDTYLRLMGRGDGTKLRSIDARIQELRHQRRVLLDAAWTRADIIEEPTLRAMALKREADAKRGYPGNAVPKKAKGHRRPAPGARALALLAP